MEEGHEFIGGDGVVSAGIVVAFDDLGDLNIAGKLALLGGGGEVGFCGAGVLPIEVENFVGLGILGVKEGDLVHEQAVFAVGQVGVAEVQVVGV